MEKNKCIAIIAVMVAFFAVAAYAQGADQSADALAGDALSAAEGAKSIISQPKDLTIYGEVRSVNAADGTITVQYYDYDTDEEKTITLAVAGDAKLENVPTLGDIKKGDWADITYKVQDTKNMVKSIIVEKEEEIPTETMPEGETE